MLASEVRQNIGPLIAEIESVKTVLIIRAVPQGNALSICKRENEETHTNPFKKQRKLISKVALLCHCCENTLILKSLILFRL